MKKKKNKKPYLVFIYGFVAVGKLTVAKELAKSTKYKLLHNHMMIDLIDDLFGRERPGTVQKSEARQWMHFGLAKRLISAGNSCIFTHAYWRSFVYKNGVTDLEFVKKIKKITTESGGIFCPVYLFCSKKEMLRRVKDESRKSHKKLRSIKTMKELLKKKDCEVPAPLKNNFIIDTTKTSPKKAAKMIKEHFNLK
jgi:shikimate kinase